MTSTRISLAMVCGLAATTWADPTIHVSWEDGGTPQPNQHYAISTSPPASAAYPDLTLLAGSLTWRVWSTESGNPGDIGVISCPASANFGVRILDASDGPGARHVKGINLVPNSTSNYSNIVAGTLTGNLDGDLVVQRASGGSGGEVVLTIDGDVLAGSDVTIPRVKSLVVGGDVGGSIDVGLLLRWPSSPSGVALDINGDVSTNGTIIVDDTEDEAPGQGKSIFEVGGNLAGAVTFGRINSTSVARISGDVSGDFSVTDVLLGGQIYLDGDVASTATITINDIEGYSRLFIGDDGSDELAGRVIFTRGIPSNQFAMIVLSSVSGVGEHRPDGRRHPGTNPAVSGRRGQH